MTEVRQEKGSVLILVLIALFILSALALASARYVSSDIDVARYFVNDTVAYYQARAGVERAVMAILSEDTNELNGAESEYWSNENSSIPGGYFSVTHLSVEEGVISTNYGAICEAEKVDANQAPRLETLIAENIDSVVAPAVRAGLRTYKDDKKLLTKGGVNGKLESLYELLLVPEVTPQLFVQIEPYITVFYGRRYFSGISEGVAVVDGDEGRVISSRQISFVYDQKQGKIVYWHE